MGTRGESFAEGGGGREGKGEKVCRRGGERGQGYSILEGPENCNMALHTHKGQTIVCSQEGCVL